LPKGVIKIHILQLVDRLEELLERGWRLPLSSKVVLNEDTFLNIVDQMRISIPQEIKQAREVREERDKYIAQAHEEARRIIAQAREDATQHLDSHRLREAAENEAEAILKRAEKEAAHVRIGADRYAEAKLRELAEQIAKINQIISSGIEVLKTRQERRAGESADEQPVPPKPEKAPQQATLESGSRDSGDG